MYELLIVVYCIGQWFVCSHHVRFLLMATTFSDKSAYPIPDGKTLLPSLLRLFANLGGIKSAPTTVRSYWRKTMTQFCKQVLVMKLMPESS